ncbi:MAG: helicase-exonuclease AddAB subunit AddA, partial [Lachnospiraceae bacterium]|nr:helicase-exonuclease AddAB subunit AddA [Lachnospiraceae bacterium]
MQKYDVDFGEADVMGESEDVVRIMTIHKSKGLEFPVVFVSGISKKFNETDSRDKAVIHPDMGLGLDEIQSKPRMKRNCLIKAEIADRIRRDNLGEELRVLYVALTRAKEKLILTGTVKKRDSLYKKHKGMAKQGVALRFSQRMKAKSYMDWIVPAILSYPNKYEFTFVEAKDIASIEVKQLADTILSKEEMFKKIYTADETIVKELQTYLSYEYPYKQEADRKSKYSVSEIKRMSMLETYDQQEGLTETADILLQEQESYIPDFAKNYEIHHGQYTQIDTESEETSHSINYGLLRGTAIHRVMECLDIEKLLT